MLIEEKDEEKKKAAAEAAVRAVGPFSGSITALVLALAAGSPRPVQRLWWAGGAWRKGRGA